LLYHTSTLTSSRLSPCFSAVAFSVLVGRQERLKSNMQQFLTKLMKR